MQTNNLFSKNVNMLVDFYELAMANGYLANGLGDTVVYFDMFYRTTPDAGGFAVMAGVEQIIDYLENLSFTEQDIDFLRAKGFDDAFLGYLINFKFSCDIWAVPEGTPIFPGEPIVTVRGPIIQAQLIETMLLLCVNHQCLIATKANRIARAAQGRALYEFGSRRAQGFDAALYGARAAYIGGSKGSSCVLAEQRFGIPTFGTMTHSWVQMFDSELEAFCTYAKEYPNNCSLLVDTYNTLKSGMPNAIAAFEQEILPKGFRPKSVRIDSGDIAYLSRKVRRLLDEAGFPDCEIIASNSLDEYIIRDMIGQGAKVDIFCVGERLITSASSPIFGGVYKLCAIERNGLIEPKIKISENVTKITTPCFKKVWRLFDRATGKAIADLITLAGETINENEPYELFDPDYTWKRKTVSDFVARPLLQQIFSKGKCVYDKPALEDIRNYCAQQVDTLWEEVLRFENPHTYYVDLSQALWTEKQNIIEKWTGNKR
jgi:nicotinate phosphoribosyltransferase